MWMPPTLPSQGQCWDVQLCLGGAMSRPGAAWAAVNNTDNNKMNSGEAVAGFIDSWPKSCFPAEVSARSPDAGRLPAPCPGPPWGPVQLSTPG